MSVLDYVSPNTKNPKDLPPPPTVSGHWLGWAVYLGMSWTWCIGMFLPVLLVRDYGIWGWIVFAIPNVLGAALMGYVLSCSTSRAISENHRLAIYAFSFVTALFQLFFALWAFTAIHPFGGFASVTVVLAALILAAGRFRIQSLGIASAIVLLVSVYVIGAHHENVQSALSELWATRVSQAPVAVWYVAVVSAFGFALCPYLDATFHRARQSNRDASARAAFGVGFGALFFAMIFFSLMYADTVRQWMERPTVWYGSAATLIAFYWMAQLALTIGLHWNEMIARRGRFSFAGILGVVGTLVIALGLWVWVNARGTPPLNAGETVYRVFLGFYGLIFPAYVWLCMIPGRGRISPTKRQLIVLAIAVLIAAPMFWMGFIEKQMVWLLPGVGIVLLGRLFIPSIRLQSATSQSTVAQAVR